METIGWDLSGKQRELIKGPISKKVIDGNIFGMNIFLKVLSIFIVAEICFADTLYLKDGKTIISETVWEKDDYYMYTVYGATVGISKNKVDHVEFSKEEESSFQFDIWPFGITVNKAIDIAEKNDVPLHKSGIITVNKRFHPQVRKYSDATDFYYNTNLLGHFAKVELAFTPSSKKLHTDFGQLDFEETENLKIQKIKEGAQKDNNKF